MRPLAALGLLLGLVLAGGGAARADDAVPVPDRGRPWFGPGLDWTTDSAEDYQQRLGLTPSLYAQRVGYPLDEESATYLRQFVAQAASQGSVAVVDLEPSVELTELTDQDAADLTAELADLHAELGTVFLLRFAPEMNGTWYAWGQQPGAYVDAFRMLAERIHGSAPFASMVWSPVYGAGYPYGAAYGDVDPDRRDDPRALDTDGSGVLDGADDPYGPYWPGAAAVDWVGLTLYHFGVDQGRRDNELDPVRGGPTGDDETSEGFELDVRPSPGAFRERLEERFGYEAGRSRSSFYERFAERHAKPFLVETGALWIRDDRGDPEPAIKRAWWRQVLSATDDYPWIRAVSWLEQRRPEAEADGRVIDWRATRDEDVARALRGDLRSGAVALGPVTSVPAETDEPADPDSDRQPGADAHQDDDSAPAVVPRPRAPELAVVAVVAALLVLTAAWRGGLGRRRAGAQGTAVEARATWPDSVRGSLLVAVVAAHTMWLTGHHETAERAVGAVGVEGFIVVSGLLLGAAYVRTASAAGASGAVGKHLRRALGLYAWAVVSAVVFYAVLSVPGAADEQFLHFVRDGGVRDLYPGADRLTDYPTPWAAAGPLLGLVAAPWVINVLGLLVVLVAATPLVMEVVRRGGWWLVLPVSWALWALGRSWAPDPWPAQFLDGWPPLAWQLLFVHALVLGHHRQQVLRVLDTVAARVSSAVLAVGYACGWGWAWWADRGAVLADEQWSGVDVPAGRALHVTVLALAVLSLVRVAGPRLAAASALAIGPLGARALGVLLLHAFSLLAVVTVLGEGTAPWWQVAVACVAQLGLLWVLAWWSCRRSPA